MPDNESNKQLPSEYDPLEKPEFKPNVPDFLLQDATPQDKYIIERLDLLAQHAEWSTQAHLRTHEELRYTNGKVRHNKAVNDRLEEDVGKLNEQAKAVSPFLKGLEHFANLWQYKVFRWIFSLGIIFVIFVLYPLYLKNPSLNWFNYILKAVTGS